MKIDEKVIDKLADLSKLEFPAEEKIRIQKDLERILSFVEQLKELDTNGIQPLVYMSDERTKLRSDVVKMNITHEEALLNAPKKDSDFIKAPKVIE